jgi:hypothetical protein
VKRQYISYLPEYLSEGGRAQYEEGQITTVCHSVIPPMTRITLNRDTKDTGGGLVGIARGIVILGWPPTEKTQHRNGDNLHLRQRGRSMASKHEHGCDSKPACQLDWILWTHHQEQSDKLPIPYNTRRRTRTTGCATGCASARARHQAFGLRAMQSAMSKTSQQTQYLETTTWTTSRPGCLACVPRMPATPGASEIQLQRTTD